MPAFPKCNEGFRRLSIVAAIVVCVAGLGIGAVAHSSAENSAKYTCSPELVSTYSCDQGVDLETCRAERAKNETTCRAKFEPNAETDLGWLAGIAFATYLAALIVRTLGWIIQGFMPRG